MCYALVNNHSLIEGKMGKKTNDPAEYIEPLHINGMAGRVMHAPGPTGSKKEILLVYGHHSNLERWWGLVENLRDIGSVTMPDLPGFGGMDSFYSIGESATIDNYADYLAAYIKMRYNRKKVSIVGISFGFLVVTRMLQRNPELTKKIEYLVSAVGFMHHDEFLFNPRRLQMYRNLATVFSVPPLPKLFRYVGLNKYMLRAVYARTHNAKHKFKLAGDDKTTFDRMMDMEIELWQSNDVRTYLVTSKQLLTIDNTKIKIDLPVWHVFTPKDNYFDNEVVEQHMRVVFSDFIPAQIVSAAHAPSVIADKAEASILIPRKLRTALKKDI